MQLPRAAEGVSPGGPAPEDSFLLDDNRYIADVLYDFRWGCGLELGRGAAVSLGSWGNAWDMAQRVLRSLQGMARLTHTQARCHAAFQMPEETGRGKRPGCQQGLTCCVSTGQWPPARFWLSLCTSQACCRPACLRARVRVCACFCSGREFSRGGREALQPRPEAGCLQSRSQAAATTQGLRLHRCCRPGRDL